TRTAPMSEARISSGGPKRWTASSRVVTRSTSSSDTCTGARMIGAKTLHAGRRSTARSSAPAWRAGWRTVRDTARPFYGFSPEPARQASHPTPRGRNAMQVEGLLFDAYGTLFDIHSVVEAGRAVTDDPESLSALWRQKQLEYTWLRSLMGRYEDFWAVTEAALVFTGRRLGIP